MGIGGPLALVVKRRYLPGPSIHSRTQPGWTVSYSPTVSPKITSAATGNVPGASTTSDLRSRNMGYGRTWVSERSPTTREPTSADHPPGLRIGNGWRRAQMVLWSAQGMDVQQIAKIAFTSEDRVRAVIQNFNDDGFDSLAPKYAGGRPPTFNLPERREIKKIALSRPMDHNLPFSTWSLSKLAEFLVAEGVVDDISHEGLRVLLREEGLSFQVIKTWKQSNGPDFEAKKNRSSPLRHRRRQGGAWRGRPDDGALRRRVRPLNLLPRPGKQWAPMAVKNESAASELPRRRRRRAIYNRNDGVRHLMAAYDLHKDKLYGHVKVTKNRTAFLEFCRYLRTL